MFYSNKEFTAICLSPNGLTNQSAGDISVIYDMRHARATAKEYERLFSAAKKAILARQPGFDYTFRGRMYRIYSGKWFRPWDIVPSLREFSPPVGDYGIGVEVEVGFNTIADARRIVNFISKWRYIAIDHEGPAQPAEVTFPPVLYSKFGSKSKPCKYLKLLKANEAAVYRHLPGQWTGTHINVSKGGVHRFDENRRDAIVEHLGGLTVTQQYRYFGRNPYGYINPRRTAANGAYLEYKLFNTTKDWRVLRRYVDIAVELTDLLAGESLINNGSVLDALERGYNKHIIKEQNNAS